mgnify:CR=1 FL=1
MENAAWTHNFCLDSFNFQLILHIEKVKILILVIDLGIFFFSLAYQIDDQKLSVCCTAYRPHKNLNDFLTALRDAFKKLKDVLV